MLYNHLLADRPLDELAGDWDLLADHVIQKFSGFKDVGDNVVGIRTIDRATVAEYGQKAAPVSLPAVRKNYEIGPNGIVEVPRTPYSAYVTLAGTPHRTQHVFGYWHINDKDEIIVPLPPQGSQPGRVIIIMGRPHDGETDRFAWYCEQCVTLLFMRESRDFGKFWASELKAVREYNADPAHQRCPCCGHRNPLGYSGLQVVDTPEERAARFAW